MRSSFILLFFFVNAFISNAQFDITSSYNLSNGIYKLFELDHTGISEGNGGGGQVWDFSSFKIDSTLSESDTVLNASDTPYASDFINATHAIQAEGGYEYFIQNSTGVYYVGEIYVDNDQTSKDLYKNGNSVEYTYPFVYGSTQINSSEEITTITQTSDGSLVEKDYIYEHDTLTIDGYGTLIVPGGNSYSAIRMKIVTSSIDSSFSSGFDYCDKDRSVEYQYYSQGIGYPVITINFEIYQPCLQSFPASIDTHVVFYDPSNVLSTKDLLINKNSLKVYPNPASETIIVDFENTHSTSVVISIEDLSGVIISKLMDGIVSEGPQTITFQVPDGISKGVYFIKVQSDERIEMKKLIMN